MGKKYIYFFIFLSIGLKSQESSCTYVEKNAICNGYDECDEDVLYFTSSISTIIQGAIYAKKEINIKASSNFSITFKPIVNQICESCIENNDTTIKPRGTGGGKGTGKKNSNPDNVLKEPTIRIRKNPAKNLLEIYNPKNIAITQYNIYDSFGNKIQSSSYSTSNNEILISHLPNGIYRVVLNTNENITYTLTFIKN